jgi:multicomponent Na+:H+ antiporter subunit D
VDRQFGVLDRLHARQREQHQTRFYVCFALAIAAAMGIAFAANLFTLFLFYEVLTLITYPLVTHAGTDKARAAGRSYLAILMGTSDVFLLPRGDLRLAPRRHHRVHAPAASCRPPGQGHGGAAAGAVHVRHRQGGADALPPLAAGGDGGADAGLRAAARRGGGQGRRVQRWSRSSSTSSVSTSSPGGHRLAGGDRRLHHRRRLGGGAARRQPQAPPGLFDGQPAVLRRPRRAMLAPLSLVGAVLHIAAHAFGKITLFFAAGAIYTAAHKTEVSQLDGIGRRMPWTMAAFTIGALSMIGLPPAAGFVSKWYMLSGAMAAQQWFAVASCCCQHAAQCRLFPAHRLSRLLPSAFRRSRRPSARRGAAADGRRAVPDRGRHAGAVLLSRRAAGAGTATGERADETRTLAR